MYYNNMVSTSHQEACNCEDCTGFQETPFIQSHTLHLRIPLDNDKLSKPRRKFTNPALQPSHPLWSTNISLQTLPNELYREILSHLTIQEVTDCRQVSQYTRSTIDRILQYQELHIYSPSVLRACLATRMAPRITLRGLYHALTHPECTLCGTAFATNFSLLRGERICVFCLRNDASLQPIATSTVLKLACKPRSQARRILPIENTMRSIPGGYRFKSIGQFARRNDMRKLVFLIFLLSDLSEEKLSLLDEKERELITRNPESAREIDRAKVKHNPLISEAIESNIDVDPSDYRNIVGTLGDERELSVTLRFMTSIPMPFLPPKSTIPDWGRHCHECMIKMRLVEWQWMKAQWRRQRQGQSGAASERRRELINEARRKACTFHLAGEMEGHMVREHGKEAWSVEEKDFREMLEQEVKRDVEGGGEGDLRELMLPLH